MKTFGKLYYDSEQRWRMSEVSPHVVIRLKNIFKGVPVYATSFSFPDTGESCTDLEWFLERYPMQVSKKDYAYLVSRRKQYDKLLRSLEEIVLPNWEARQFKINGELRHYQAQFVELFLRSRRILLSDDVGLGKTAMAIGAMTQPEVLPAAVIAQTHLPGQWKEEVNKFLPKALVHLITKTTPYNLPKADVYIFKYSQLAGWTTFFEQNFFNSAFFDEVQELRRRESLKYQGATFLSESVKFCAGLSATPIYNYGGEIFNVMDAIKKGCLGEQEEFLREWCVGEHHVVTDPKALGAYLRDNFLMVRRTRKEVGRELPETNKIVHTVEMDEEAMDNVEQLARSLAIRVTSKSSTFFERGEAARELDLLMRQATGIGKAKFVAAYVKMILSNGEPVLLAGWHRAVYDIWLKELADFNPVMFTGSESLVQKKLAKKAFQEGETNLMIISLRSGVGLDGLQSRCSILVVGELDWSGQVHDQLVGRLRRDGQNEQVTAIFLVSDEGSDPVIVDVLGLKASQSKDIMDPTSPVSQQHSDESRVKVLAQRYLDSFKEKTKAKQLELHP